MSKFAVLSVFIFNHLISNCHFQTLNTTQESIQELNDKILATADDLFISLRIDKNFTKQKPVAGRLLIHDFVQNVSKRNHKKYKEIHNVSKTNVDNNKTANFIFIINEVFEDILTRERNHSSTIALTVKDENKNIDGFPLDSGLIVNLTDFNQKVLRIIIKDIVLKHLFANPKKSNEQSGGEDLKQWVSNITHNLGTRRIYRGESTSVEEFPFMASVHIAGQFSCAGVILSKDLVITAASCLQVFHTAPKSSHVSVLVRVGSDFTSKHGRLVPVADILFHPDYDHNSLANNLVILKLGKRLNFNPKIRKLTFDNKAHKMPENVGNILILGWGDKGDKGNTKRIPEPISYAHVELYNLAECKNIYSSYYVKDKHFCTGYVTKGSGACNNDIGGPAIVGSSLTGIISFGSPFCGRPDAPTVFTKVGYYAQWITNIIEEVRHKQFMRQKSEDANKSTDIELDTLQQLIGEIQAQKHVKNSIDEIAHKVKSKYLKRKRPLRSVIDTESNDFEFGEKRIFNSAEVKTTSIKQHKDPSHMNINTTPDLINEVDSPAQDYGAQVEKNETNLKSVEENDKIPNLNLNKITIDESDIQNEKPLDDSGLQNEENYEEYKNIPQRVQVEPSRILNKMSYSIHKPDQILEPIPAIAHAELEGYNYNDDYEDVTGRDLFIDPEDDQNNPTMTIRTTRRKRTTRPTQPPLKSTKIGDDFLLQMTIFSESESTENARSSSRPITPKKKDGKDLTRNKKNKIHKAARSKVETKVHHKQGSGTDKKFDIVFWNGGTTRRFSEYPPNKENIRKGIFETMDSFETAENSDVEY